MRGRKNPPLDLTPAPDGAPVTFDTMATAYLQDYQLQRYRSLNTARPRVEHLRGFFGGLQAEAITPDRIRSYQIHRRERGFETSTMNWQTFSQVAFAFAVTPRLLAQGLAYAVVMGIIGGLLPALLAARLPIASALREL